RKRRRVPREVELVEERCEPREHVRVIAGPDLPSLAGDMELGAVERGADGRGGGVRGDLRGSPIPRLERPRHQAAEPLGQLAWIRAPPEQTLCLARVRAQVDT